MVTVKFRSKGCKRFKKVKTFRRYNAAWNFVADSLIEMDFKLHLSSSVQYLCDGYSKKRVFPFGSTEVSRKGNVYKIVL